MSKYYLDLGCYEGTTVQAFYGGKFGIDPTDFISYGFDPIQKPQMAALKRTYPFTFIKKAVWVKDETHTFSTLPNDWSSTLMAAKSQYTDGKLSQVKCIDIAAWLEKHVKPEDDVVVKMNIEGAEIAVLDHLVATGAIKLIDDLLIEWHGGKLDAAYDEAEARLKASLPIKWRDLEAV